MIHCRRDMMMLMLLPAIDAAMLSCLIRLLSCHATIAAAMICAAAACHYADITIFVIAMSAPIAPACCRFFCLFYGHVAAADAATAMLFRLCHDYHEPPLADADYSRHAPLDIISCCHYAFFFFFFFFFFAAAMRLPLLIRLLLAFIFSLIAIFQDAALRDIFFFLIISSIAIDFFSPRRRYAAAITPRARLIFAARRVAAYACLIDSAIFTILFTRRLSCYMRATTRVYATIRAARCGERRSSACVCRC